MQDAGRSLNCNALAVTAMLAGALLLAGCKASKTNKTPPSTAAPSAAASPSVATSPSRPQGTATPRAAAPSSAPAGGTPARTPEATAVARAGVPGQVTIGASRFTPADIAVEAGRPVTFVNADSAPHRAVSNEAGLFDTGEIPPGSSAQITVSAPGFHDWHDAANPSHGGTLRIIP